MLKNDLLKNDGEIIRIITIKNNQALVIDCIKRNMPYWINIELLESYIPCNDQELLIISHKTLYNIDELDARSQSIIYFRYGIIESLIYEIDNKKKRNILIKNISIQNNISGQTLRKYLCDYLAFQDKTILAPKKNISNKTLSKDEKNIRWALNKFFYTKRKNSLYTAYLFMLKEKYTINDKLQESHPSFYQFRYFYRKTKKLQTYYISRNGIKDYQKNHRPLLGNGIKEFAPTIGTGMLDSTICDIYLINTDGNIIGRPILTVCIDAYCGLCYGYNLSWKGGIYSISGLMENIVSDKHLLCEKFGINIGEHEWINKSIPGTMVTDKGTEYISASFEQLAELGVKIINLPAYRPELKGRVEKFFDIIQTLYKSQLKGMGVIETDYLQRGAHDYKKDAKLTLNDFEKIILHCILYYNTKHIIKNFSYTEDMIRNNVPPYSNDIWNWIVSSQKDFSLIPVKRDKLKLTLLPRVNGIFRRNGLIVNNIRYKNDTYKEYYLSGKIVNVAYDPNNIDSIWLIENGDYVKFNLIELEYSGKTLNEIEELRKKKKQILKAYQENEYQSRINLISEIDNVKNLVKQRNSVPVNTKYITQRCITALERFI